MAFQRDERGRDGKVTAGLHFLPFGVSVSISKACKNALLTHGFPRPLLQSQPLTRSLDGRQTALLKLSALQAPPFPSSSLILHTPPPRPPLPFAFSLVVGLFLPVYKTESGKREVSLTLLFE